MARIPVRRFDMTCLRNGAAISAVACMSLVPSAAQQRGWGAAAPGKDSPLAGGNLANQRYSAL